jgi:two-component system, OmpR family, response regulator RstA
MSSMTPTKDERPSARRILLVEDDLRLAKLVEEFLSGHGFRVDIVARGDMAAARILADPPDLVVLDLMLPGRDGISVCREIRPKYAGPILMLTALGDEVDEIVGLEVGADDYLAKPVRPRLLLAHINSLLRRTARPKAGGERDGEPARRHVGGILLDRASRRVTQDGVELTLTTMEFDLLWFLAGHAGQVVTRDALHAELRGGEWDGLDRAVDIAVARLRRKLGDDGKNPQIIKSVRGAGYLLAATENRP